MTFKILLDEINLNINYPLTYFAINDSPIKSKQYATISRGSTLWTNFSASPLNAINKIVILLNNFILVNFNFLPLLAQLIAVVEESNLLSFFIHLFLAGAVYGLAWSIFFRILR